MKTRKFAIAALAVLSLGLIGGLAFARGPGFGGGGDPQRFERFITWRVNDALDKINATDAQRQKILAIKDRLLQQARASFGDRGDVHEQLLAEWQAQQPDARKLHALVDQRADEMKRFGHSAVDAMLEAHQALTPEQRAQLAKDLQEHRFGHGPHGQN